MFHENIECYHEHSYEYKSRFLDNRSRTKNPHIGFELEVQCNNSSYDKYDCHGELNKYFNDTEQRFCYENDCSIGYGFECISRPADIKYWVDNFASLEKGCRKIARMGCCSHNGGRCGLHVHIDRNYFGTSRICRELAEAKMLWIFEKHWDNMVRFSRRRNFEYCERLNKGSRTIPEIIKYNKSAACGHYTAVNVGNSNTIELRLWRGSLRPETIKATLKFSVRLAELVKNKTVCELNEMSFEDILGDDEDILAYWETVKDRAIRS